MISADHKRCSTRPSVDRPNYDLAKVFFVALRGQKEVAVAVAVLRGPPCPPWTNVLPLQFFVALRGQKEVAVAVAVLRGPPCPPWTNVLPLQFFVALRGQKEVAVAVAVLRGPPCPPWTNVLPLQFFVALRGQKEVAVAVAVLRGPPCPPWTNVLPLQFFVALRGQKEVAVAVAVLRGPPCPPWTNVLPLQFFVVPFVDKRKLQSPLQFSAALRVLRGQMCCRCSSSSWPFVVLRGKRFPPHSPFEDRPNYDLAYLSSDKRQRALVTPPVRGISLSPLPYPLPPAVLAFEAGLRPCEPIRR